MTFSRDLCFCCGFVSMHHCSGHTHTHTQRKTWHDPCTHTHAALTQSQTRSAMPNAGCVSKPIDLPTCILGRGAFQVSKSHILKIYLCTRKKHYKYTVYTETHTHSWTDSDRTYSQKCCILALKMSSERSLFVSISIWKNKPIQQFKSAQISQCSILHVIFLLKYLVKLWFQQVTFYTQSFYSRVLSLPFFS